jgi:Uma2 family endonuclease
MLLQTPNQAPTNKTQLKAQPIITWEALPADFVLPDDPVENIEQSTLAAALNDALGTAGLILPEMLIATNFGLVATVNRKLVIKAPDWVYVPNVPHLLQGSPVCRSYTPNLQGDAVAVVMEFLSETDGGELSMRSIPPLGKLYFYEQILRVPTYVIYDSFEPNLEVRCLQQGKYAIQVPDQNGQIWIPQLELFLGIWAGERFNQRSNWLRWWDRDGNLLQWSNELADRERQRAEQERQRANQAVQLAEQERLRAEQEYQRAETLAQKLIELGIDPISLG